MTFLAVYKKGLLLRVTSIIERAIYFLLDKLSKVSLIKYSTKCILIGKKILKQLFFFDNTNYIDFFKDTMS